MLKKLSIGLLAAFAIVTAAMVQVSPPETTISNGIIEARLYLPDQQNGYYRGSRFDWAGVINTLNYKGHNYFGPWRDHDPMAHDAITGPAEYFEPLGYNEAKPGETFVKIGVGRVRKPDDKPYSFSRQYEIVDHGTWEVHAQKDRVEFIHRLTDKDYPYVYKKTVQLANNAPRLLLTHELKNLGQKTMETETYNHNFFVMDNRKIGPEYTVEFPYPLTGEPNAGDFATIEGNRFVFNREITKGGSSFFGGVTGFTAEPTDYRFDIRNSITGAGVTVTSDQPIAKLNFWASPNTICPEPYISIRVNPDETLHWTINYDFFTTKQ